MLGYPISSFIELTSECNLKCLHCYNNSGIKSNYINYDVLCDKILDLNKNGVVSITISGGEPFKYPEIWKLLDFIKNYTALRVAINSNGILIGEKTIRMLKKRNIADIQISIDGSEFAHDIIRGKGTYKVVLKNIKKCIENDLKIRIGYTVNAVNYRDIEEVAAFMKKSGVSSIAFYRFVPTSERNIDNFLDLDNKKLKLISEKLIYLSEIYNKSDSFRVYFEPLSFFSFLHNSKYLNYTKCLAGEGQLNISFDNNIYLCPHLNISLEESHRHGRIEPVSRRKLSRCLAQG